MPRSNLYPSLPNDGLNVHASVYTCYVIQRKKRKIQSHGFTIHVPPPVYSRTHERKSTPPGQRIPSMASADPEQPAPTQAESRLRSRNRAADRLNPRPRKRCRDDPTVCPEIQSLDDNCFSILISMLQPREMLLFSRGCRAFTRGGNYRDYYRDELEHQEPLLTYEPCPSDGAPVAPERVRSLRGMRRCLRPYLKWIRSTHRWDWIVPDSRDARLGDPSTHRWDWIPRDIQQADASSCIRTILRIVRASCNSLPPRASFPSLLVICTALNATFDHLLFSEGMEYQKPRQTRRIARVIPARNRLPKRDLVLLARALSRSVSPLIREPVVHTTNLEPYIDCMCTLMRLSPDLRSIILREDMLPALADRMTCVFHRLHPAQKTRHPLRSIAIPEFVRHAAAGGTMSSECMATWRNICVRRITTNSPPVKSALDLGATLWLATDLGVLQQIERWIGEEVEVSMENYEINLFPHFARLIEADARALDQPLAVAVADPHHHRQPGAGDMPERRGEKQRLYSMFRPNYLRVHRRIRHMTLAAARSGNVRVLEFLRIRCKRLWCEFDPMVPELREAVQELLECTTNHQRVVLYLLKRGIMPRSIPPIDISSIPQTLRSIVPILLTTARTSDFQRYGLPSRALIDAAHRAGAIRVQLGSFNPQQRIATVLRAVCDKKWALLTCLRQEPSVDDVFHILDNTRCVIAPDPCGTRQCDKIISSDELAIARSWPSHDPRNRGRSSGEVLTELIATEVDENHDFNPESSEHTEEISASDNDHSSGSSAADEPDE